MRGKIICFEGLDACGKDTQIDLLKEYLESKGIKYKYIPQLNMTDVGRVTREKYLTSEVPAFPFRNRVNELLFTADRLQYVFGPDGVIDSVDKGYVVILNRFIISAMVYALFNKGEFASPPYKSYYSYIKELNKPIIETSYPDLTVYLRIMPQVSQERIAERNGTQEFYENSVFLGRQYEKFEHIIHEEIHKKHNIAIIDGNASIDQISHLIQEAVDKILYEGDKTE